MKRYFFALLIISGSYLSCSPSRIAGSENGKIDITFVQVNDVYEIAPLEGGTSGGYARVATLKKKYLARNPNTFLVMAGDFLSPSVYNSLQYEGKRIRGRQMVEVMNTAKTDLVVFGNHEFDISESELQSRLNESTFQWISSNSFHKKGNTISAFVKKGVVDQPVPETYIIATRDTDGTTARIGFIGITLPFNKAAYVSYTDPLETAIKMYDRIKDSCDVVIALTHQSMKDDVLLAQRLPGLAMILGGHEHDHRYQKVGNVIIAKAHANAKSAYILHLNIDKRKKKQSVKANLEMIDQHVVPDPETDAVVQKWTDIAEKNYASIGFDARKIIWTSGEPLEGREGEIRSHPTNLTRLIVDAMAAAAPQSELVLVNAGSIRLDDLLQMPVSQYDILRTLPFGGSIVEVDMKGALLVQLLEAGRRNKGIGGFLHYSTTLGYDSTSSLWKLHQQEIVNEKVYRVAMTDFLLTGGEANMGFLKKDNPGIVKAYPVENELSDPRSDIRLAIIRYMEANKK